MEFDDLDRFDRERPKPPPRLYKYVVPARIDVLQGAAIRFTPPLNTNDIFEVRQTFDLIAGPKMRAYFKDMSKTLDFEDSISNAFKELGLETLAEDQKKTLLSAILGPDPKTALHGMFAHLLDHFLDDMNSSQSVDEVLTRSASKQLLLSLSERADSSPMWAHYADNSKGFVIAFDTASEFFRRGEHGETHGLHKVRYFDGRVSEIMDDPFAALVSKQADWAYEREWRLYARPDDVTHVLEGTDEAIHLVSFPRKAVRRVILGLRTSEKHELRIREVIQTSYPDAELTRMHADRETAALTEQPIE